MVDWNCGTRRKDKLHKPASQMLRKSQYAREGEREGGEGGRKPGAP